MTRLLRAGWQRVRRRIELIIEGCVARVIDDRVPGHVARALDERVPGHVVRALDERVPGHVTRAVEAELSPVLDALLAEQFRLQAQLDDLRRRLDALADANRAEPEPAPWRARAGR